MIISKTQKQSQIKGFTLVEMSIVIVIVAVIIGGVIAGQEVLEGAKRQAIMKEIKNYEQVVGTFVLQYTTIPGDISNASSYWSGASDGDGDGEIEGSTTESVYFWNHLSRAELVEEYYDGTAADLLDSVPQSAGGKFFYKAVYASATSDGWDIDSNPVYEKRGNFFGIGAEKGATLDYSGGVLSAEDAKSMDSKIDDGNASAGRFVAIIGIEDSSGDTEESGCITDVAYDTEAEGTVDYDLDATDVSCRLIYWMTEY